MWEYDVKILVINDIHAAASPPLGCTPAYTEDIFNMLEEAREYCVQNDVDATVFTGDIFHHKRNVADWVKYRLMDLFKLWPGDRLAIAGNHDLGEEGLASIPRQPIGLLFRSGALEWLDKDTVKKYPSGGVVGRYEDPEYLKVQFSPVNYFDEIDDDPANFSLERMDDVDWAIKIAHGSLVKPGKKYPDGFRVVPMDTVPTDGMDLCLFGHLHHYTGIIEANDCFFASLGSLGRVARTDYNKTRKMELLLVSLTKDEMSFEKVPLKSALPPEELYLAKAGGIVDIDEPLSRFARDMSKMLNVEDISLDDVLVSVTKKGVPDTVLRRVKTHLEEAGY